MAEKSGKGCKRCCMNKEFGWQADQRWLFIAGILSLFLPYNAEWVPKTKEICPMLLRWIRRSSTLLFFHLIVTLGVLQALIDILGYYQIRSIIGSQVLELGALTTVGLTATAAVIPGFVFIFRVEEVIEFCGYQNLLAISLVVFSLQFTEYAYLKDVVVEWSFLIKALDIFSVVMVLITSSLTIHATAQRRLVATCQSILVILYCCIGRGLGRLITNLGLLLFEREYVFKISSLCCSAICLLLLIFHYTCLKPVPYTKKYNVDKLPETQGWLPGVAGILWRRMLGVLGNPTQIPNPKTHFHFYQVLTDIISTLFKIKLNQCISIDNTSTPKPSELVPPLTIAAPWCLSSLELPDDYHKGRVLACSLLCEVTLANQDLTLPHEYLCKFYGALHKRVILNKQDMVNEIVKKCGPKFICKMLPGFSLLALDLIQAAHSVMSCEELKSTPRAEAATLLGSVLVTAEIFKEIPVLKPNSMKFHPVQSQQTKEIVISCLIMNARKERTSHARAIILQSLTTYLVQQLMEIRLGTKHVSSGSNELKRRLNDILSLLLDSIRVENRSVALVASDLFQFLSEFSTEISNYMPELCSKIILGLKLSLQQILPLKVTAGALIQRTNSILAKY